MLICFVSRSWQQGESSLGNLCFSWLACLSQHPPCRVIKSGTEIRQARKKLQWHSDSTCSGLAEASPVKSLHTKELSLGTHKSKSLLHIGDSSQGGALAGAIGLGCKLELETPSKRKFHVCAGNGISTPLSPTLAKHCNWRTWQLWHSLTRILSWHGWFLNVVFVLVSSENVNV